MISKEKALELIEKYENLYLNLGISESSELLKIATDYEKWFIKEFLEEFKNKASWESGNLKINASSSNILNKMSQKLEKEALKQILNKVEDWTNKNFAKFYIEGLKIFDINHQLNGYENPNTKLSKDDLNVIKTVVALESSTWKENLMHHIREVKRHLHTAMFNSSTYEELIQHLTCLDKHIVSYRIGNSRISWYEVCRRYSKNRPRVLAQMANRRHAIAFMKKINK